MELIFIALGLYALGTCALLLPARGELLVHRAGTLLAAGASFLVFLAAADYLLEMIELTAVISMGYAVFNLIPIPPLDGSKVLFSVMDEGAYRGLMRYERYGGLALMALSWSGVLSRPLSAAIQWAFRQLLPIAWWAYDAVAILFS
jgi:Zn-dependent protease